MNDHPEFLLIILNFFFYYAIENMLLERKQSPFYLCKKMIVGKM